MTTQTKPTRRSRSVDPGRSSQHPSQPATAPVNEIHLVGRLSAPPVVKHLPSGAEVVQLRVVVTRVPRPGSRATAASAAGRAPTVDTIDIACWSPRSRRRALACAGTEVVDVTGSLRRRFWRSPNGVASRYEVEADTLRVLKRAS